MSSRVFNQIFCRNTKSLGDEHLKKDSSMKARDNEADGATLTSQLHITYWLEKSTPTVNFSTLWVSHQTLSTCAFYASSTLDLSFYKIDINITCI